MDLSFARKHIEQLYVDTCTVIEYEEKQSSNFITGMAEKIVYENIPCKLSHKTISTAGDGTTPVITQVSKLILQPDIEIKAGSKIIVTRNGIETAYKNSGEPARYLNHQEIMLNLLEEYA